MKIYRSDPNLDYYARDGDKKELKSGVSGGLVYSFPPQLYAGAERTEQLARSLNVPAFVFYQDTWKLYAITTYESPPQDLLVYFVVKDSHDGNPVLSTSRLEAVGRQEDVRIDFQAYGDDSIEGSVILNLVIDPLGGWDTRREVILWELKLFVEAPPMSDLAITSTREVGFYDTAQYLYTATGERVKGLGGYKYRTLEVEIARTSHDAFQSFIESLHIHGLDKPLWLSFDKDCHSKAFTPYDGFKCTLENTEEIMLQGGIRKDFYKTKLKFREWID